MPKIPQTSPQGPGAPDTPRLDTSYLETLVGYNARRAALAVIEEFLVRMKPFDLRPVDFSVLSVIAHNPGVTSRQLCSVLGLLPPNLVAPLNSFEQRGLIERRDHPNDGRAWGLHLTNAGQQLMAEAEKIALALEVDVAPTLTIQERKTLIQLLQKLYL
jgi:DNA-binding MarR family transcriptional regulator